MKTSFKDAENFWKSVFGTHPTTEEDTLATAMMCLYSNKVHNARMSNRTKSIDVKNFIVHGFNDNYDIFIVFENDNIIYSVEHLYESDSSVYMWYSIDEFINGITWHDYIYDGITEYGKYFLKDHLHLIKKYDDTDPAD